MNLALDAIRTELHTPGDGAFRDIAWLKQSWLYPEAFAKALWQHLDARESAPRKSSLSAGYDLYHDLVLRHVGFERTALYWLETSGRILRLTYSQLHTLCSERRAAWRAQGAREGQCLCVLAELGTDPAELVVPLLTGLRMGLKVSLLPPGGPDFLSRRLEELSPDWVAAARRYQPLLQGIGRGSALLGEPLGPRPLDRVAEGTSHTYPADAVALKLFSPLREPPEHPVEVSAADAYKGALRDGHLLLGLHPGQVVAAAEPGLPKMQPALLFCTLLCGAAFLSLRPSDFQRDLRRSDPLSTLPRIHVLFVNAALRRAMLAAPALPVLDNTALLVSDPQEQQEPTAWGDFTRRFGLAGTPAMSLLVDATCGGGVLFSLRRLGGPPGYLMPVPGRRFLLLQPGTNREPARGDHVVFEPAPAASSLLLTRAEGGYLYAGTRAPTCDGKHYPAAEVEAAIADLPFVRGATVVSEPGSRGPTLLVFTGPETQAYARAYLDRRQTILRQRILQRLTPDHLPPRILLLSQLPRLRPDGQIDHLWCARMLLSGDLHRRGASPVFALLDRLMLTLLPALRRKNS